MGINRKTQAIIGQILEADEELEKIIKGLKGKDGSSKMLIGDLEELRVEKYEQGMIKALKSGKR